MVAILVLLFVITFITIDYFVQRRARGAEIAGLAFSPVPVASRILPTAMPRGIFFDETHQWAQLEAVGTLKLGLDMLPGAILGSMDSIELPKAGAMLRAGDPVLTVRKNDRAILFRAPFDGVVEEVNHAIESDPSLASRDPYNEGWLYRMFPKDLTQAALVSRRVGDTAATWMRTELGRLREFLSGVPAASALPSATLLDGGFPVVGCADSLNEEQWNKLVEEFFK